MKIAPSAKWLQIRNFIDIVVHTNWFCGEVTLKRLVDGNTIYVCIVDKPCMTRIIRYHGQDRCYNSQMI